MSEMTEGRVTCRCGRSVLPENWSNHLLRQDGGEHGPAGLAVERLAAAERDRIREAVEMVAARAHRLGCRPGNETPVTDWQHCPNSACREVREALEAPHVE